MSRSVEEWIGATDDSKVPDRVRLRVFQRCGGRCHVAKRKIMPGEPWDLDHIKALCNGGEHRESNLAPALRDKHREKTAKDVKLRADADRKAKKHIGIRPKSRLTHPTLVRGFDGKVRRREEAEL